MNLARFAFQRIAYAVVLVLAVIVLNFLLIHLAPGDPVETIAGAMGGMGEEMRAQLRHAYGLDRSLIDQLGIYLGRMVSGDLGYSFYFNLPVAQLILQRVPATLFLEQARCALALREPLLRAKIAHVHATGSRSLVCGLLVRKILGVTVSATVEEEAGLSRRVLEELLYHCVGGRVGDEQLAARLRGSFLYDLALARRGWFPRMVQKIARLGPGNRSQFWDKWAEHLLRWSRLA